MDRSRKQILAASLILAAVLACYFGVKEYTAQENARQEEEEAQKTKQITDFEIADVAGFSYHSAGVSVTMTLTEENWKYSEDESLEIDTEKVESFLESFQAIESQNEITGAEDPSEYGIGEDSSSITIEFSDGEVLEAYAGDYNEVLSLYYFKTNASENIYTVSGTVVNKLSYTADNFEVEEEEEDTEEEEEQQTAEETADDTETAADTEEDENEED